MRRAVLYPLTCALALATAVALLGAAAALGDGWGGTPPGTTTEVAVRRFYAAANAAILTGDGAAFAASVGPSLVDHTPPPGATPDGDGLARYLAALHATSPRAELVVQDLVVAGDRAIAWVAVRGADRGAFLGLPLAAERPLWATVDAWRVADGRVVERWGGGERPAFLESFGRVALAARLPARQVVEFARLTIPPGAVVEAWRPQEARLVQLESGALTVSVARDSPGPALVAVAARGAEGRPTGVGPEGGRTVAAGDMLALRPLTAYTLRNDTTGPVNALVMTVSHAGATTGATRLCGSDVAGVPDPCAADAADASAVAVRPLAGGRTTALAARPLDAALGRATLAPGEELPVDTAGGPALLHVEGGTLGLETDRGTAWVRDGATGISRNLVDATLGAGDGALLRLGTAATLRNAGDRPLVLLVATVFPSKAPTAR